MTITEKAAYLRGLADGLKLDESKDEVKVINKMLELIEDIAAEYSDLSDFVDEISEQVDEIDEDLATLEDDFDEFVGLEEYDDDDFACDCDCDDCDECCFDEDEAFYEVTCPTCDQKICLDEDMLNDGEVECPNCGEILEFDIDEVVEYDEDAEESKDTTEE